VFLDRLFDGAELDREWADADRRVVPEATGKTVIDAGDAEEEAAADAQEDPREDRGSAPADRD
jgi:tRNA (cytidine56-2'-O)-methyltransferase